MSSRGLWALKVLGRRLVLRWPPLKFGGFLAGDFGRQKPRVTFVLVISWVTQQFCPPLAVPTARDC
ncbi:hypothetical protein BDR05DRAFT_954593 [Suillus weaverae]|nr:hypothetical protein BDR05DRAFT_954593 [Suillus weaverae]